MSDREFYDAYIRANSPGYPHDGAVRWICSCVCHDLTSFANCGCCEDDDDHPPFRPEAAPTAAGQEE